jgi:transposase
MIVIRKDPKTFKDGRIKTQIRVVEGYRPGPGLPPKQRTIKDFGYLEDQSDQDAFMKTVVEFNAAFKKDNPPLRMELQSNAKMYCETNRRQNYGYKFLDAIYKRLEISKFINNYEKTHHLKNEYSLADIFKLLVLLRIISPKSKRSSYQIKDNFYDMKTDFTLKEIYRALDVFASFEIKLQHHLNEKVKLAIGRDVSYAFFDVTNYFFEIDFPDENGLRKRGVSKEHRVDPIVGMGLFIDSNGLPISMSIFPGNTSESLTLRPIMEDIKKSYGLGRLIVVADKGLNSSDNINEIVNNGDGYVVSQVLKGKKGQRYQTELFDENGYEFSKDGTYKYKLYEEEYTATNKNGVKEQRKRKVLIYWDKNHAEMTRHKREEKLKRAEKAIKKGVYGIKRGIDEYMKEEVIDKKTGEALENTKKIRSIDLEKAENEAKYDGYYCIITSECEYGEKEIRKAYGGLWRIERSFRILKSDLYARPVFVWKSEHIKAHFLICFTALLVVRMIQHMMGKRAFSTERIARVLNMATCQVLKGGIIHLDDVGGAIAFKKTLNKRGEVVETLTYSEEDEIALDYKVIQETFGTNFYDIYPRQEMFNKFLKNIGIA